jgi:superfamily II DNA or RNA helicase
MPLRPYQQTAIRGVYSAWRKHDRALLQLPTGSGKTHVAESIIEHGLKHGKRINFCVDRLTLLDQTLDRFYEAGFPLGVLQGGHPMSRPAAPVQIVSLQTLQRRDRRYWPAADLFIFDEAHTHYGIISNVMDTWDGLKYLGLSATPFTRGLGLHWQKLVVGATTEDLMVEGYLSPYVAYGPSSPDLRGVRQSNGDFNTTDLAERMNVITGDILAHFQAHAATEKTIVFTPTVAYAEHMAEQFRAIGITADYVCGKDSDERRQDVLGGFKDGSIQVLCNCEVLIKGYDQPDITCGIVARPTRSLSLHIQMLGRLLRTSPGKERALILDHAGNIERLGFPDDPLPNTLCTRERGVSSVDTPDREEPEPWNCPQCHMLVPPRTRECPQCGFTPRRPTDIEILPGELVRIGSPNSRASKQVVYSQLLFIAQKRRYSQGWASHKFRKIFGVWPRGLVGRTEPPSRDLLNWIRNQHRALARERSV